MIKMTYIFAFRRDMAAEEAMRYYEEKHAPLICELFNGLLAAYKRNYVVRSEGDGVSPEGEPSRPAIDVITEIWVENEATIERIMARMNELGVAERVAQDEAKFLDRASMQAFRVVERETDRDLLLFGAADRRYGEQASPSGRDF